MKILVFSDTHLTVDFSEKKYRFLTDIINNADQVVINGDFWEGYLNTFDEFLQSPWKGLFPLLKRKHSVYIYGNHDRENLSDKRSSVFSDIQTHSYSVQMNGNTYVFEHGDKIVPLGSTAPDYYPSKFLINRMNTLERFIVRNLGSRFIKASYGRLNKAIKKHVSLTLTNNEIMFCGHTHYAEIDEARRFVNSGIIKHGVGQYLWIDNGRIISKEEWYS